mmetsp:Transcript_17924/g.29985  ORF Transcript_17924/g.29985 Transcript_17924/m.29985 type:complete len:201 (-) Transcript_17924:251-853(-)
MSEKFARMTVPTVSFPRRPARPAICVYSPGSKSRNPFPSFLRYPLNTTARAGMFTPIANVSVARRTLTNDLENKISTASFNTGSNPPWWTANPRVSISVIRVIWGSRASSGFNLFVTCDINFLTSAFSLAVKKSIDLRKSIISSHFFLEKQNTTTGKSPTSPSSIDKFFSSSKSAAEDGAEVSIRISICAYSFRDTCSLM